jgi:hypothetical protein
MLGRDGPPKSIIGASIAGRDTCWHKFEGKGHFMGKQPNADEATTHAEIALNHLQQVN